jgi:MFS family permease
VVFGVSWPLTNAGAVAPRLAEAYDVRLGTVGAFTTVLLAVHLLVQVPGGRLIDRYGGRLLGFIALAIVVATHACALLALEAEVALSTRALAGIGTGVGFLAGSAYLRAQGFGARAQGVYGGAGLLGAGVALFAVPVLAQTVGWRAPFYSAIAIGVGGAAILAIGRPDAARSRSDHDRAGLVGLLRHRGLRRLAAVHAASFGLSLVVANWVVTLLTRAGGHSLETAGAVGALTLAVGVTGRPFGGIVASQPDTARARLLAASLVLGGLGVAVLAARPTSLPVAVIAAAMTGFAGGIPFAATFTGAGDAAPSSPSAAMGVVNMAAIAAALVGTLLVGLSFDVGGAGRPAFFAVALLWAGGALVLLPLRAPPSSRGSATCRGTRRRRRAR